MDRKTRNQLWRWMRTDLSTWSEPRAEIILAVQATIAEG
jgi:hypothetical protein